MWGKLDSTNLFLKDGEFVFFKDKAKLPLSREQPQPSAVMEDFPAVRENVREEAVLASSPRHESTHPEASQRRRLRKKSMARRAPRQARLGVGPGCVSREPKRSGDLGDPLPDEGDSNDDRLGDDLRGEDPSTAPSPNGTDGNEDVEGEVERWVAKEKRKGKGRGKGTEDEEGADLGTYYPNQYKEQNLLVGVAKFGIPPNVMVGFPKDGLSADDPLSGDWCFLYLFMFRLGLRLPIRGLIREFLWHHQIVLCQLVQNS